MSFPSGADPWSPHWNRRTAISAGVHLLHSAAILVLILLVPGAPGAWLLGGWCAGLFFSVMALLLVLRVGSYEGTTDAEVGGLVRQCYWMATGLYLGLLAASLYVILAGRA